MLNTRVDISAGDSTLADLSVAGVQFDESRNILSNGSAMRHLAPREAAVLSRLLEAPLGTVTTRTQLLDSAWPHAEIGDEALTVIISRLRRHFRFVGVEKSVIETIPRIGYRLVAEPKTVRSFEGGIPEPTKVESVARTALSIALIALGIALTDLLLRFLS